MQGCLSRGSQRLRFTGAERKRPAVKVDVEQGEATVALYALPRVDALRAGGRGEGPGKNDKTTVGSPRSSHDLMAGARLADLKTTLVLFWGARRARWAA